MVIFFTPDWDSVTQSSVNVRLRLSTVIAQSSELWSARFFFQSTDRLLRRKKDTPTKVGSSDTCLLIPKGLMTTENKLSRPDQTVLYTWSPPTSLMVTSLRSSVIRAVVLHCGNISSDNRRTRPVEKRHRKSVETFTGDMNKD